MARYSSLSRYLLTPYFRRFARTHRCPRLNQRDFDVRELICLMRVTIETLSVIKFSITRIASSGWLFAFKYRANYPWWGFFVVKATL